VIKEDAYRRTFLVRVFALFCSPIAYSFCCGAHGAEYTQRRILENSHLRLSVPSYHKEVFQAPGAWIETPQVSANTKGSQDVYTVDSGMVSLWPVLSYALLHFMTTEGKMFNRFIIYSDTRTLHMPNLYYQAPEHDHGLLSFQMICLFHSTHPPIFSGITAAVLDVM
jgi:hypothetical protein